jgi:DNA-binding PadR family transcriptional regulator
MQVIQDMTLGSVEIGPATMYTTLKKLNQAGWITEISGDDSKILYQVTEEGRNILRENFNRRKQIIDIAEQHFNQNSGGRLDG